MTACPSCGAAVSGGDARCPLCGTDLAVTPASDTLDSLVIDPSDGPVSADGRVCPSCGHANPGGARFCNSCGTTLAAEARSPVCPVSAPAAEPAASPDAAGRRALLFVGGGVAIVVALFAVNALSARAPATPAAPAAGPGDPAAAASAAAAVPDGPTPPLPDSLQQQADAFAGQNTSEGWFESGRFYLTAGVDNQQSGDARGILWIRRAIADFERSLEIEENADVRYALAEAAQFDPSDAMRPTLEAQKVIQDDPNHPGGNYMLGVRRLQIGRVDSARVSFERVLSIAPQDDPFRALATQRLAEIAQTLGAAGAPTRGVPDGAGAPPPAGVPSALPPALPPAP